MVPKIYRDLSALEKVREFEKKREKSGNLNRLSERKCSAIP